MYLPVKRLFRILLAGGLIFTSNVTVAAPHNGFDLSDALIDSNQIHAGGPPRDGIPAIDNPQFINASNAAHVQASDRILGIQLDGVSKAYPIGILNWHEIVNDEINGSHFAITYCPLCGTGVAYSAQIDDNRLNFGVSGLLYNSDVLLYDRQSESLWSQILGQAISGPYRGNTLEKIALTHTSWADWVNTHPDTLVLSEHTGYSRDYRRNPYSGYENSRSLYFQVSNRAPSTYHPKERVLGLQVGNKFRAYPFSEIDKANKALIRDEFGGKKFHIRWDRENQQASISDPSGKPIAAIEGFWFAWYAFHPETEVFTYTPGNETAREGRRR